MALAMLLAAFALPRGLTIGLAALGLLIGLAGAVMPRSQWHLKDGIWLLLGGGGSGLILLAALVRPGWLNERWGMDFTVPEPDRNTQMMVSRDNPAEGKELHGEDRVDARTHAIRQGDLLIRIDSAAIERSPVKGAPVLLINLTLANAGQLHDVTYHGQASGDHPAQVRDSRGKELSRRDLGGQAKKMGQVGKVVILPNHEIKDVLAVETPWSGTSAVEVDLPSAAWGREGVCRFTLPANFIVSKDRGK